MSFNDKLLIAAIGLFNFLVIFLLIRQVAKKYIKPDQDRKPIKLKNLFFLLMPYIILFLGAIFTRYYGQMLLPLVLTIILSMIVLSLTTHFLEELQLPLKESGSVGKISYIITRLIPFTVMYFLFLFAVHGFNFEKMRNLKF